MPSHILPTASSPITADQNLMPKTHSHHYEYSQQTTAGPDSTHPPCTTSNIIAGDSACTYRRNSYSRLQRSLSGDLGQPDSNHPSAPRTTSAALLPQSAPQSHHQHMIALLASSKKFTSTVYPYISIPASSIRREVSTNRLLLPGVYMLGYHIRKPRPL